ncbi:unnamed protein product [Musa acuminata var. zebrina]
MDLREWSKELPDDFFLCLVGDMITEENVPTYQTIINTNDSVRVLFLDLKVCCICRIPGQRTIPILVLFIPHFRRGLPSFPMGILPGLLKIMGRSIWPRYVEQLHLTKSSMRLLTPR